MAIRAYNELYIDGAQNILGHAVDYAVMSLECDPDGFGMAFSVSRAARQFASGNPSYVAGMNGCELAREVLNEVGINFPEKEDTMYLDKSPEYWAGWALAFFQWYSDYSFSEILSAISLEKIIKMYSPYHEMDILQFTEQMQQLLDTAHPSTRLFRCRKNCTYSQSELARESGVPLRQIQLFEQRQREINKASAITLLKLSKALHCRMEDLMEKERQ